MKQKGKKLAETFASTTEIDYICTMIHTGERYINPLTDFGFKRIFGTEFNKDLRDYEQSANAYRDIKNGMDTAMKEGLKQGRAEEKRENARKMKSIGIATAAIQEVTGLATEEIEAL